MGSVSAKSKKEQEVQRRGIPGEENCQREQLQEEKKTGKSKENVATVVGRSCWPRVRDGASNHPCLESPGQLP